MSEATTRIEVPIRRETAFGASQVIRSPEQVALDLTIAGPMSRVLAFSIDYGLILIVEMLVLVGLVFAYVAMVDVAELTGWVEQLQQDLEAGELPTQRWFFFALAIWIVLEFVLQWGYFVVCELSMQGRSPGKAAVHLRVVREGGLPVTLRESMIRNLLRMVDMLPTSYFVGLTSMVFSPECRRLGDYAAGTLVVRDAPREPVRPIATALLERSETPGPAFRFDRAELDCLGPVELRLIRQTLRRLDELPGYRGRKILARSCDVIRRRIGYTEAVAEKERRAFLAALLRDAEDN